MMHFDVICAGYLWIFCGIVLLKNFSSFSCVWSHFPYICTVVWQCPSGRHIDKDAELALMCGL